MLVYKGVRFSRFARKAGISDEDLIRVVERADQGLVDADLGGGVIKQRITRKSSGAAGSARTLILYRREQRAIFVFGFEKKDMANITKAELQVFRENAKDLLWCGEAELARLVTSGDLIFIEGRERNDEEI